MDKRRWMIAAGAGAAAVALTLGVALTRGGDATANAAQVAGLTAYVAGNSDGEAGGGIGVRARIRELMTDAGFRADVSALRDKHEAAMDRWWDTYADDPDSEAAREARQKLREQRRDDMHALLEKHGVDTSGMDEARAAARQAREKVRELMADDDFRADMGRLRDEQQTAVEKWWGTYAEDPTGDKAREAMRELRDDARADMEKLLKKYGVELPDGPAGKGFGGGMMGPDGFGGGMMERGGSRGGGECAPPDGGTAPGDRQDATTFSL